MFNVCSDAPNLGALQGIGIPRYIVPGMILGCIAASDLSMPGSPQVQNVGLTLAALEQRPWPLCGSWIYCRYPDSRLNVAFLNFAAIKEIQTEVTIMM